ncbi:MAG: hypothetical protein MR510_10945 [Clostridium sp.]|jgi:hypothetical protein|uniref:hypothetical protein n=1 Tax=Clostridium sp. TaxID=1506 RepID=UPI0025C353DA|nr:hypothetical protein [Clostridium sp.]MCI6692973.1 hypothetical protein [Clostridium sp.]MDY2630176.1 hypothetical protein [Clostridium sp.]MDY4251736.1 hypothetical protein [Clostridium sp.]MDY6226277.1 hypothetical protein [Clostridium sp.]
MKKKYVIYTIVIIITFLQCYVLLKYSQDTKSKDVSDIELNSISISKNVKNIKDIKNDFTTYKTITIVNYNKLEDGSWKIKCLLKGSKEDILNDIEKINNYEITDYSLGYEKNNILIEANLIYK